MRFNQYNGPGFRFNSQSVASLAHSRSLIACTTALFAGEVISVDHMTAAAVGSHGHHRDPQPIKLSAKGERTPSAVSAGLLCGKLRIEMLGKFSKVPFKTKLRRLTWSMRMAVAHRILLFHCVVYQMCLTSRRW